MQKMLVLDSDYVNKNLRMEDCIRLMEETFEMVEEGRCQQYLRTALRLPNGGILGMMPGYFEEGYFGAKILSVYLQNGRDGYPSHQGQILLFEKEHGQIKAVVDAMSVTRIRTGAVTAAASKALANPDSEVLALLGSGEQARAHIEALACCFPLKEVRVWSPTVQHAEEFKTWWENRTPTLPVKVCRTAEEAVRPADIVCTLTPSKTPLLKREWLKTGAHVNAVGACSADARELDSDTAADALFFGDNRESVFHESGDFLLPLQEGRYTEAHFLGTLGQVLKGTVPGRTAHGELTIFDALGMAVEDIAAAEYLYWKAAGELQ